MAQQEVILVTGANTGLGYQIVRALCQSDKAYNILVGGRSSSKIDEAIQSAKTEFTSSPSSLSPLKIDIEDDDSIRKAFNEVQTHFGRVDILLNNAGGQFDQQLVNGQMTERDMWNHSWNVNVAGTQVMTSTFIPLLLQSGNPRLLFITSGTSTLAGTENMALAVNRYPTKGWPKPGFAVPAYRSSKTGMNMMMREWHRMLREDGVKVWSISPGFLATGLGGNLEKNRAMGAGDPSMAGEFIRDVVQGSRDADIGKVLLKDGVQAW